MYAKGNWSGWLLVGLLALALAAGCDDTPTDTPIPASTITPTVIITDTPLDEITDTPVPEITDTPVEPTADKNAKVLVQSMVRRLTPVVWAGPAAPLPEVASDAAFELQPGGMISTDQSGEAEVSIEDCLKIYLYQGSQLKRSTCHETDQQGGLAVCSLDGMISVINQCLSQVVIVQTPNSEIVTHGTEFTVMYDAQQDLTVVQVLEGRVAFTPILANIPAAQPSVELQANTMIFTTSKIAPTLTDQLPERQVLPLERWEILRSNLTVKNPYVDLWMESTRAQAVVNQSTFPQVLIRPSGTVIIDMTGAAWNDPTLQKLVSDNIPWTEFVHELWPDAFVKPQLVFPEKQVNDARFLKRTELLPSTRTAIRLRGQAQNVITIFALRGNANAEGIVKRVSNFLVESGFRTQVEFLDAESLKNQQAIAALNTKPIMIITLSGSYFE